MKIISTKIHGVLDYLTAITLIASPSLFHFGDDSKARGIVTIIGGILLLMSLFTNYELSARKRLSMKAHLRVDFIAGLILALSPYLFEFRDHVYLPHVIIGSTEMLLALITDTRAHTSEQNTIRDHIRKA